MADRKLLRNPTQTPPQGWRFVDPNAGKPFSAPNFRALKEAIAGYRRANQLPIGTDFDAEIQDWICRNIPDSEFHCYERGKPTLPAYHGGGMVGTGYQGQQKWKELHVYALTTQDTEYDRAAWLANFTASLPCGECRSEWRRLTRRHPAPLKGTNDQLYDWSVERHNDVNRRLGKKTYTPDEARAFYV